MSDPIAAAEAAGKARDIANRFETAVFLIAYGIAEKDGLYEADPHRSVSYTHLTLPTNSLV